MTTNAAADDEPQMYPSSVEIFYNESKAARDVMDQLLLRYRTITTTVLALATGAATFFGFSSSPKGWFFVASLVSYGVATIVAIAIYWPTPWRVNVAYDVAARLTKSPPMRSTKLRFDLARGHQQAITQSIKLVGGWRGQANKFRILLLATSLVVIFAGVNGYLESKHPTETQPTHIVIDQE